MANPSQLVATVAAVLGISTATVTLIDRELRDGGLRSTRGRGWSAPVVTSMDAANLLIAIAAMPVTGAQVRLTRATMKEWAPLVAHDEKGNQLEPPTTLQEAIAELIDNGTEALEQIDLWGPLPQAFITLRTSEGKHTVAFREPIGVDLERWAAEVEKKYGGDLGQRRMFGSKTLDAIANLIGSGGRAARPEVPNAMSGTLPIRDGLRKLATRPRRRRRSK
jgi:hypothetical protein